MAKFINTRKAVSEIEDLIKNADQKLVLISPYLKLSKDFKELLTYRNSKDKITTVIFGKQELKPDEMTFLQGLRFVVLKFKEDLHAKCYVNDQHMIITSLNLYEFSMANNREMGVLIDKNDPADSQLFEDAMKEVDFISETSQRFELSAAAPAVRRPSEPLKTLTKEVEKKPVGGTSNSKPKGYCIRTGVEIPFNVEKPLSYEAYKSWSKYSDPNYAEKFCHFSGEPSGGETSVSKPILKKNWSKAKAAFNL
jgi:phosphatidylserine/phosphatidylglycerophosphate/cardiolipin synthase-like enzyme